MLTGELLGQFHLPVNQVLAFMVTLKAAFLNLQVK